MFTTVVSDFFFFFSSPQEVREAMARTSAAPVTRKRTSNIERPTSDVEVKRLFAECAFIMRAL
jgi:hypothetical protein